MGERPDVAVAEDGADRSRAGDKGAAQRGEVTGVLVEQQIDHGLELIVGLKRDPSFGALVMVGLAVSLARDVRSDPMVLRRTAAVEAVEQAGMRKAFGALPRAFGAATLPVCVDISPQI